MRHHEPARGSWFGAVVALGVLAVAAFFVGALFALAWKEPGLLLAYLRGDTTEIAWSTASAEVETTELPAVGAEAPADAAKDVPAEAVPEAPVKVASKPAAAKPAAKPAAVASRGVPSSGGAHIAVQVGAFGEREAAERLSGQLREAGYPAYLVTSAVEGEHWRVRVGPYKTREEASRVASRLQLKKLPTWVLDEEAE